MRINMNLLFYLKKKRSTYKNGSITIYSRFTVDGRLAETSTGKSCDPNRWNANAGRGEGPKQISVASSINDGRERNRYGRNN